MDEIAILGREDDRHSLQRFLAHYDTPAYVRRARQVEEAFEQLLHFCRQQRGEALTSVRRQLGQLQALAGAWEVLRPWLKDDQQLCTLRELHALLQPELRWPPQPSSSSRVLRQTLRELCDRIERFNRWWQSFLPTVNLATVNELRADYNRYYLLEKECALRSVRLARQGFRRLEPVTVEELAVLLPPLVVPELKE